MERKFDEQSLAENNGQDGSPAYIAHEGKVYDVSESKLWKSGKHMKRHLAGHDLSSEFSAAPHGSEVFERYPQVGIMEGGLQEKWEDEQRLPLWLGKLLERYPLLARHPHPAMVHFPIAFILAAPLFSFLALLSGNESFETTSFHCLAAAMLIAPLTIGSGFFTWWLNYEARMMKQIRVKIFGSVLLMVMSIILFAWRYAMPDLLLSHTPLRMAYLLILLSLVPVVGVIGWNGAILTFPHEKK